MRWMKWISLLSVLVLIGSCFMTWVEIPSRDIVISGIRAEGTQYGKPGYLHLVLSFFFLVLLFVQRIWAKRLNVFLGAINLAWAIRNFVVISGCYGGECPQKKWGIYLVVIMSVLMLVTSLFPDMRMKQIEGKD